MKLLLGTLVAAIFVNAWGGVGFCAWEPVFVETFSEHSLNPTKWSTSYGPGREELQRYVPHAFRTGDEGLEITAQPDRSRENRFVSGIITTEGKFKQLYGYFEIRVKLPRGQGFFPAFWLMPASKAWPPEIDVFEYLGHDPYTIYMTHHWLDQDGRRDSKTEEFEGPDFSDDFHTFGVEWRPDRLVWYVDGEPRHTAEEHIPQEPMFLLVNLAVGGEWPGPPDHSTPFPGTMVVDYVKVYQRTCRFHGPGFYPIHNTPFIPPSRVWREA